MPGPDISSAVQPTTEASADLSPLADQGILPAWSVLRWSLAAFLATVSMLAAALELGRGAPAAAPPGIPDPGAFTGWALPVAKVAADTSVMVLVGLLLTAVFLLPATGPQLQGLAARAVGAAGRVSLAWALATGSLFLLTVSDVFAVPLSGLSWALVSQFATTTGLGRALLLQVAAGLLVAVAARRAIKVSTTAALLGLTLAGLVPQALTGHSAAAGSHDLAVVSLLVHLLAASGWVGGLAGLGWVAVHGSRRLAPAVLRFSALAAWCVGVLAISGVVNAVTRIGSLDAVDSRYGLLVAGKLLAIVALAGLGWAHRRHAVPLLRDAVGAATTSSVAGVARRAFVRIAAVELAVMAATIGLAVALSRTPTPVPENLYTGRAEELLGESMPPAPTVAHLLVGWSASGVGLALFGLGLALYARGVWALHRRGDRWPVGRTVAWLLAMLIIAWSTFGGLGRYSHVLFSAHMAAHMLLSMVVPIFVVLAAPVTLALRTLPGPRQRGEIGPRQMLVSVLHSRVARVVTHPLVAAAIFVGSLYGLYFSGLFDAAMNNHLGHAAMQLHFLAVGTLYYYVIVGVDPAPRRLPPLVRFGMLMITIPFHAFFAIAVMSSSTAFGASYYEAIQRPFRTDLLADQYLGGGIAWAMGELPLVLVMGALFVQWITSDRREAARFDRNESGNADQDLDEYNAYLASLSQRSADPPP